jgi:hypothetical protein
MLCPNTLSSMANDMPNSVVYGLFAPDDFRHDFGFEFGVERSLCMGHLEPRFPAAYSIPDLL